MRSFALQHRSGERTNVDEEAAPQLAPAVAKAPVTLAATFWNVVVGLHESKSPEPDTTCTRVYRTACPVVFGSSLSGATYQGCATVASTAVEEKSGCVETCTW